MVKNVKTHYAFQTKIYARYAMASIPKSTATAQTEKNQTPRISVPTTIKHVVLLQELQRYDRSLVTFLVNGFKFEFRLGLYEFQSNCA